MELYSNGKLIPVFFRKCDNCGRGMNEGYILEYGTFCSLTCADLSEGEWNERYDEDGDEYWTEWEEPDDPIEGPFYNAEGEPLKGKE